MSTNDPIADMMTRIRNAQGVNKKVVRMPSSKTKVNIAEVLKSEGYIVDYHVDSEAQPQLEIELKYQQGEPVISRLDRFSRPGLRQYRGKADLPRVMGGLGIAIVSTSKGVMTDQRAREEGHGGEVLCVVA